MVQQLRLCTPNAGGLGSIPGRGTRSRIPQLKDPACHNLKIPHASTKIPHTATKTWWEGGREGGKEERKEGRKKERQKGGKKEGRKERKKERTESLKKNQLLIL